ncbi:MAG: redox-regulated ATPase YchF [Simkaniaceae bacterium]|nr:redox-regulated ATPase YchF [Simkaniaceae bacterium]
MAKLSCGIVGLPNVGKSTLFNALLKKAQASASNYPFCTIDPNVGIVDVPDERLDTLADLSHSKRIVPATVTFIDIAGLVANAAQGEGLGNQFLANIRETDLIIHVVRCFRDTEVTHVMGDVDPVRDIETIDIELILSDLQMMENRLAKLKKQVKGDPEVTATIVATEKVLATLSDNLPARSADLTREEKELLRPYPLITAKRVIYVANVAEEVLPGSAGGQGDAALEKVLAVAKKEDSPVIPLCIRLEQDLLALTEREAREYLSSLGTEEAGLSRLIKAGFEELGLITFLTTGEEETRAWTIKRGTDAREAAGAIHTDIRKGFIRAEIVPFEEMVACGGRVKAREKGKARTEGRDYIVRDGDVVLFFHN